MRSQAGQEHSKLLQLISVWYAFGLWELTFASFLSVMHTVQVWSSDVSAASASIPCAQGQFQRWVLGGGLCLWVDSCQRPWACLDSDSAVRTLDSFGRRWRIDGHLLTGQVWKQMSPDMHGTLHVARVQFFQHLYQESAGVAYYHLKRCTETGSIVMTGQRVILGIDVISIRLLTLRKRHETRNIHHRNAPQWGG